MSLANNTTATTPKEITCMTCQALEEYGKLANSFATNLATVLQTPMNILFVSLSVTFLLLVAYKMIIKNSQIVEFIPNFVQIFIASILLTMSGVTFIERVYNVALHIMTASSSIAFQVASRKPELLSGYSELAGLAYSAENAIKSVFGICELLLSSGGWLDRISNIAYALALALPYFLLLIVWASQVVVAVFRIMMLAVFSPFFFMVFSFGWGMGMAQAGIKTLISAILVLFASTVSLGLTIYGVNTLNIETLANPANINNFTSFTDPNFITVLFLGWTGTALLYEGTSLANSIAGSSLTNTAAGVMTAGASTTALLGSKAMGGSQAMGAIGDLAGTGRGAVARGVGNAVLDTAKGLATGESSLKARAEHIANTPEPKK